jgi:hypothetical protein
MKTYDLIINNVEEPEAMEYLRGFVWCECEVVEQPRPTYSRYVDEYQGVALWYDYGADYYFFEDVTDED